MNTRQDNLNPRPKRSVFNRQITRNILRKHTGNNRIAEAWHRLMKGRIYKETGGYPTCRYNGKTKVYGVWTVGL